MLDVFLMFFWHTVVNPHFTDIIKDLRKIMNWNDVKYVFKLCKVLSDRKQRANCTVCVFQHDFNVNHERMWLYKKTLIHKHYWII